jgi:hypothetical protein
MIPLIILAIENNDDREFMISVYVDLYPVWTPQRMWCMIL